MPLSTDLDIDYVNGIISYVGGFTGGIPDSTYDMNAVYSYLMDVFDEPAQLDDPSPMDGLTPTNYEILYPWFIDNTSAKAFYGGAIESNGWTKVGTEDTSNIGGYGITVLKYSADGSPTQGSDGYTDKGTSVSGGTSGATGDILWADNTNDLLYVRNTSATQFQDGEAVDDGPVSWNIDTDSPDGFESGESLWSNLYSLAQIKNDTDIYLVQDDVKLTSWWADAESDHLDILVMVTDAGVSIDSGNVTVFARQANTVYDHFTADLSGGGRNPAPLATSADLNNTTGWKTISTAADHSGPFTIGEVITQATTNAKGILTAFVDDTSIDYYLIGKDLTDFADTYVITGEDSTETATANGSPSTTGPASSTATIAHGAISKDLNNGNGAQPYSIDIDCNTETLAEVYEFLKYVTRRGSTTQLGPTGGQENGEQYIGNVIRLKTDAFAPGAANEGTTLTQSGGTGDGATGMIVAYHTSPEHLVILSNVKGTFSDDETDISDGTNTANIDASGVETIAPVKQSPFGTFAGGTFFGAPGVYVQDMDSGDIKAYQLIDDLGETQDPPNEIAVSITGLTAGDRGGCFRRESSSGPIEKDRYLGTVQSAGANTVVVGTGITSDEPAAGVVKIVDISDDEDPEALLRYTSWSTSTFTLATDAGTGSSTNTETDTNILTDSAATFGTTDDVKVGDTIYNSTDLSWGYVVEVTDGTHLLTVPAPGQTLAWTSADNYSINVLPFATTTSDYVYVPFFAQVATGTSIANTYIYSADVYARFVFRLKGWKPFTSNQTVGSSGYSVAAVRTADAVVT